MKKLLEQVLLEWNSNKNQRTKLQQAYFVLVVILATASGLITLLSIDLGRILINISAILSATFVINAVSWALLEALVDNKIDKNKKSKK